jgi:uncharacterized paraquat-inducible protein A
VTVIDKVWESGNRDFTNRDLYRGRKLNDDDSWWEDEADDSDSDDDLERCPNCNQWIYEDAVSCPQCGYYLTDSERHAHSKPWMFVATVILCLLLVLSWVVTFF